MLAWFRRQKWLVAVVNAIGLLFGAQQVLAAVTATPVFVQTPNLGLAASNGTTAIPLYTGGVNGSKCIAAWATSTNLTAAWSVLMTVARTAAYTLIVESTNIPALAGNSTTQPAINLMSPANWPGLARDSDGNPFIYLKGTTDTLNFYLSSAVGSATIGVGVVCGDF